MTQAFHGADTGALRAQALHLHEAAQGLTACAQRTGTGLDALAWRGADAARAREQWHTCHARVLLLTAQAMQEAARRLLDEADTQDTVSGAGAAVGTSAGGAPVDAPAGSHAAASGTGSTWEGVRARIDRAHDVVDQALGRLGLATGLADLVALSDAAARWDDFTVGAPYRVLDQGFGIMQDAHIGPAVGGVLQGAAVLGVASDTYGAFRAHAEGDLHGTVDNAVSAVLGAGSFVPGLGLGSAALGASWEAGTWAGTHVNDAMQGTDFHARFTERMDVAFDLGGAWGMLNTPGALAVTGAEEIGLRARDLWDGLTGTGDGTLDPRR